MANKKFPVIVKDGTELPTEISDKIPEERALLEGLGVMVKKVVFPSGDEPGRYYISFKPEAPMFKVRIALEKEGWDVGNDVGKDLSFYASKRVVRSKGWQV